MVIEMAKIYIDQGHNPVNPNSGAEGNGYREQDLVFEIGVRTAEILRAAGQDVRLSRPTPETQLGTSNASSLAARVNDANAWGADYFISLHLTQLAINTGLPNRGVFARPTLYVLRRTRMPATLIELGFITNAYEASLMANQPELFAQGVANGVLAFLGEL